MPAKKKTAKRKPGHPVTRWTPTARGKLLEALREYIDANEIPILAEFAYKNHVCRENLYTFDELKYTIKELIAKKETGLERRMISGVPGVATGCIFSLKQLGWTDKQEIEHSGKLTITFAKELQGV